MTVKLITPGQVAILPTSDQWAFKGYLAAVPNQNPEIRFTFRPYLPEERAAFIEKAAAKRLAEAEVLVARAIAGRVKTWDLRDEESKPLNVDATATRRLHPAVFLRLSNLVIYGTELSDTDPRWSDSDADEQEDAELEALISGKRPVDELADEKLGNLPAG